jgi:hypothetical protein
MSNLSLEEGFENVKAILEIADSDWFLECDQMDELAADIAHYLNLATNQDAIQAVSIVLRTLRKIVMDYNLCQAVNDAHKKK